MKIHFKVSHVVFILNATVLHYMKGIPYSLLIEKAHMKYSLHSVRDICLVLLNNSKSSAVNVIHMSMLLVWIIK